MALMRMARASIESSAAPISPSSFGNLKQRVAPPPTRPSIAIYGASVRKQRTTREQRPQPYLFPWPTGSASARPATSSSPWQRGPSATLATPSSAHPDPCRRDQALLHPAHLLLRLPLPTPPRPTYKARLRFQELLSRNH
jgi:hypothetical protein